MKRGIWTSDFHLGLTTDEIDRTDEIVSVLEYIFKHAVKVKADFVVLGGDIFDHNQPSEHLIGVFISVLNILSKAGIKVFVVVGNHDAIAKHKRRSCLSFIRKLAKHGYKNLKLVDDVKTVKMWDAEVGNVYFSFLPFISGAHIDKKYKSAQQYVDMKMRSVRKKLKQDDQWFIFSHLNVKNCVYGTEEFMLKKVETWVPEFLTEFKLGQTKPTIIQGHIHTRQQHENIHVVGSPIFTAFGEKEEKKFFLQMDIPEFMGEGPGGLEYIETPCLKFKEFDFHVSDPKENVLTAKNGADFSGVDKNTIVKVNLTMDESGIGYDVEGLRKSIAEMAHYVKPIHPKIIRDRVKRNKKQTVQLDPKSAVKVWLKSHKPKNPKRLFKLANEYIQGVL